MTTSPTRRQLLLGTLGALSSACAPAPVTPAAPTAVPSSPKDADSDQAARAIAAIEARVGGRIGVFVSYADSARSIAWRADERFPMCSTFKWILAAAILARFDRKEVSLDERISYRQADLIEHSPTTTRHLAEGTMSIDALAEASVVVSDNAAANLLLARIGGPPAVTEFMRGLGDPTTRLDRNEPSLNENGPDDPRDTTTPRAMAGLLQRVLLGAVLSPPSRDRLLGWLRACETGKDRLSAGLPAGWSIGHKTGSGQHCTVNDVAIAVPPGRAPILIASYMTGGPSGTLIKGAAHAEIGRMVARGLEQSDETISP